MVNRIPQEIIEEVMQRADIVEIVGEYVALRRRGRNYFGLCPFHHEDTPSFSVNGEKQIYKCFGCGKGGNVIGFVQEIEHLSFQEAVRKLAERYHIVIPERAMNPAEQARLAERQAMLAAYHAAAAFYAAQLPLSTAAQAYMQKRGIDSQAATRFGLGCAPEEDWQALYHTLREAGYGEQTLIDCGLISRSGKNGRCYDKFHGRLIFPIRDQRGGVVAFGGRAMRGEEPKYLNSQTTPIYNKSNVLYALDLAGDAIRRSGQVVIMEGYMDVLTAHRHGVENAVATCGTAFTAEHARLLRRYAPEAPERLQVLLALDPDAAGARAAVATPACLFFRKSWIRMIFCADTASAAGSVSVNAIVIRRWIICFTARWKNGRSKVRRTKLQSWQSCFLPCAACAAVQNATVLSAAWRSGCR